MADLRKYANNFTTTLNGAITDSATSITLTSATGLPAIGANEVYNLTITDGTNTEIVQVTDDASTPTLTVTRGVDGTSGTAFADGDTVELRVTSDSFEDVLSADETPELRGPLQRTVEAGITASSTQSQGQQALTNDINEVSTVSTASDVVTLPSAAAGKQVWVINNGANILQVYPASGDDLGEGTNTSTTIIDGSAKGFAAHDATNWTPTTEQFKKSGSFTPTASFTTPGDFSITYVNQSGDYTINGDMCFFILKVSSSAFTHTTASGDFVIGGLPYTSKTSDMGAVMQKHHTALTYPTGCTYLVPYMQNSATTMKVAGLGSATARTELTVSDLPTGTNIDFVINGYYFIA